MDRKEKVQVKLIIQPDDGLTPLVQAVRSTGVTQPVSLGDGAWGIEVSGNDNGYSLMQQDNYATALPLLQQAVQKIAGVGPSDPYEGYAKYNLGYTLFRLGRCDEAVAYLKRAEKLEPDRSEPRAVRQQAQHC